jgi:hypothetical protein
VKDCALGAQVPDVEAQGLDHHVALHQLEVEAGDEEPLPLLKLLERQS